MVGTLGSFLIGKIVSQLFRITRCVDCDAKITIGRAGTSIIKLILPEQIYGAFSVTRKKSPKIYKSYPKMISLEKFRFWHIYILPKNVRDLGKIDCCQRL